MTPSDIAVLEDRLGIQLPADWKALVLNYPVELMQLVDHPSFILHQDVKTRIAIQYDLPFARRITDGNDQFHFPICLRKSKMEAKVNLNDLVCNSREGFPPLGEGRTLGL